MAFNPWTCQQLADTFHMSKRNVHLYLRDMREDGLVYTCSWEDNSPGPPSRQWIVGHGTDVPPPPAKNTLELHRAYRARPGAKEREAELKRNRRQLNKLKGRSLTAHLLGV